jgi:nitroreductase
MRVSTYPIDPLFLKRHSSRAMSGEPIEKKDLCSLFEAARWAPSAWNEQPWRFIYGFKGTPHWDTLFSVLDPSNQLWVKEGSVLVLFLSKKFSDFDGKPLITHSFDAGAAWENFALQGTLQGLVVHGMSGFNYEAIRAALEIPSSFDIQMMCVVGKPGKVDALPEKLKMLEKEPSPRKAIDELISEGTFSFKD